MWASDGSQSLWNDLGNNQHQENHPNSKAFNGVCSLSSQWSETAALQVTSCQAGNQAGWAAHL